MFPRQDGQGEGPEWTRLGTFAGGELAFVRGLLHDEGIAHRDESLPAHDGAPHSELWVTSLEHARALALVAEAQAEAEAAAYRETAALAAEREHAAKVEARAAAAEARANATAAQRAARKAARRAARDEARQLKQGRPWVSRGESKLPQDSASGRGVRILGGLLAAFILVLVLIAFIGERYGTRAPAPGHHGKTIPCQGRYQVICY